AGLDRPCSHPARRNAFVCRNSGGDRPAEGGSSRGTRVRNESGGAGDPLSPRRPCGRRRGWGSMGGGAQKEVVGPGTTVVGPGTTVGDALQGVPTGTA